MTTVVTTGDLRVQGQNSLCTSAKAEHNDTSKWYVLQQLHRTFPSRSDDNIPQCFRIESRFAIREIILCVEWVSNVSRTRKIDTTYLPLPPEQLNVFLGHPLVLLQQRRSDSTIEVLMKLLIPDSQGLRIMSTNVLDAVNH